MPKIKLHMRETKILCNKTNEKQHERQMLRFHDNQ